MTRFMIREKHCNICNAPLKVRFELVTCSDVGETDSWYKISNKFSDVYEYIPSAPTHLFCKKCYKNKGKIRKFLNIFDKFSDAECYMEKTEENLKQLTDEKWIKKQIELCKKQLSSYKKAIREYELSGYTSDHYGDIE